MSDYNYTDQAGGRLSIAFDDVHGDFVIVECVSPVFVKPEDAPTVALAILEAAGIEPAGGPTFANVAVRVLKDHETHRAEREREAEDAKAKAYRDALFPNAVKWEHLDEEIRETHRDRYRAAREFFANEESPA